MSGMEGQLPEAPARQPEALAAHDAARLVRLRGFEAPLSMGDDELTAYRRRFSTLFVDDATARRGGLGTVSRAVSASGETVALKVLIDPARAELESEESHAARVELARAAFRAEYESHRALSGFKGFPKLYGYAQVVGAPVIVMEWVEGVTLDLVARMLACDERGRLAPLVAARLGRDLFDILTRLRLVGEGFVHRDISPSNVLVRTGAASVAEQVASGSFDLCLIDFGSSVSLDPAVDPAYTARYATLRCATADYAPPEMLSGDLPDLERLRKSDKIDVYAASSVLYELVAGEPPFAAALAAVDAGSPYRIKVDERPAAPVSAHCSEGLADVLAFEPEVLEVASASLLDLEDAVQADELRASLVACDAQLSEMILAGLAPQPLDRPGAESLRDGLALLCDQYAQNLERAIKGERLLPCWGDRRRRASLSTGRLNRVLAMVGIGASVATLIAVICIDALLLHNVRVVVQIGGMLGSGRLAGPVAGLLLAAPGLAALLGRGRSGGTRRGFVRATAVLFITATLLLVLTRGVHIAGMPGGSPLVASVMLTAAAAWLPLVIEYALAAAPDGEGPRGALPEHC